LDDFHWKTIYDGILIWQGHWGSESFLNPFYLLASLKPLGIIYAKSNRCSSPRAEKDESKLAMRAGGIEKYK